MARFFRLWFALYIGTAVLGCGARTGLHRQVDGGEELVCVEGPTSVDVSFVARRQRADVVLLVDLTGSMLPEVRMLASTFLAEIEPVVTAQLPSRRFAVAGFSDFPLAPYGRGIEHAFELFAPATTDADAIGEALAAMVTSSGGDGPEAQVVALHQLATGAGLGRWVEPRSCSDGVGYACLSPRATRLVLMMTDAAFHNGPGDSAPYDDRIPEAPTYEQMLAAVEEANLVVAGLYSGLSDGQGAVDLRAVAADTGAVADGEPIVEPIGRSGEQLRPAIERVVDRFVDHVPLAVELLLLAVPPDDVDAARLVTSVEPLAADPTTAAERLPGGFANVVPGTVLTFRLHVDPAALPHTDDDRTVQLQLVLLIDGHEHAATRALNVRVPAMGC